MKYYKLINQKGWPKKDWKAGKIYPETYRIDGSWVSTVKDFVSAFVNDWQEVSEEEYNIQEGIVKEFKLPEKWCIKLISQEQFDYCLKWAVEKKYLGNHHLSSKAYTIPYYFRFNSTEKIVGYNNDNIYAGHTEITFDQFKQYVLKETTMKNQALTFKITGSKALLKAMWGDLLEAGYINNERDGYLERKSPRLEYISTNCNKDSEGVDKKETFSELYAGNVNGKFDKTFNLPEQYNEALEFAKEQLKSFDEVERFAVNDYITVHTIPEPHWLSETKQRTFRIVGDFINDRINGYATSYLNNSQSGTYGIDKKYIRKATPEEIKKYEQDALLEEAKKRYPVGTRYIPTSRGNRNTDCCTGKFKWSEHSDNRIEDATLGTGIYEGGKWAEIVKDFVEIKGYTPEYTASSVKFGCQKFSKQTAEDLPRLIDLGIIKSDYEKELREVAKHFSK